MKVTHKLTNPAITKQIDVPQAFLLGNDRQDFVNFYGETCSRYEGWFVKHKEDHLKVLANIEVSGETPTEIILEPLFSLVGRKYKDFKESYFLLKDEPVLIYELSQTKNFTVRLDIRHIFDEPQWGRNYSTWRIENGIMVGYLDEGKNEQYFVALLTDGPINETKSWQETRYSRDEKRHSAPVSLYEFEVGSFESSKLVMAFGATEKEANKRAQNSFDEKKISLLKEGKNVSVKPAHKNAVKAATFYSHKALEDLFIGNGLMAGLPWFNKTWSRDELLSIPALEPKKAKAIIKKYLKAAWPSGKIPVILGGSALSSDALGTLCWAILNTGIKLSIDEKITLADKLIKAVGLLEENDYLGFVYSDTNESWMDSIDREGYLIEIQALYAKILELTYALTGDIRYDEKRAKVLKNIRMYYLYSKHCSADRLEDPAIRPNVFLAAFFAPEILTKKEWEKVFDRILPHIWLNWGGLSSIDKKCLEYSEVSTGEDNMSYHNGDSWFFVNNIAALVLYNTNKLKYHKVIKKILEASTDEILWHNFVGRPGEISSAKSLDSWGCGTQAFSASTYIYLVWNMDIRKQGFKREQVKSSAGKRYVFSNL